MADATFIPLHQTDERFIPQTACHHPDHSELESRLLMAEKRGYGDHPVLWYRELIGVLDVEECRKRFDGNGCEDSTHKEFFSQEIEFPNNSCAHKPPGCDKAYFFPADGDRCSARTKKGRQRNVLLCQAEKQHDARLAWEGMGEKEQAQSGKQYFLGERPQQTQKSDFSTSGEDTVQMPRALTNQPMRVGQYPQISTPSWLVNAGFLLLGMVTTTLLAQKKRRRVHLRI